MLRLLYREKLQLEPMPRSLTDTFTVNESVATDIPMCKIITSRAISDFDKQVDRGVLTCRTPED